MRSRAHGRAVEADDGLRTAHRADRESVTDRRKLRTMAGSRATDEMAAGRRAQQSGTDEQIRHDTRTRG